MNTVPSEQNIGETHTEVAHQAEADLIEMGAVTQTRGSSTGFKPDTGFGWTTL